jgi:DNA-binding Xre family transcriptional regulator
MDYTLMNDDDILRALAGKIEKIRIERHIKETELEETSGISRKTLYNFRQGETGLSLKNFIRLLRALGEIQRLQLLFPETDSWSPRNPGSSEQPKRVRDKANTPQTFLWGDEK